jgi:hypothetical protein
VSCASGQLRGRRGYAESFRHLQHLQGFVTQDGTRTRRGRSAGPFSDILDKRT